MIKAISIYLPDNILTNEDLNLQFPEWSVDKISSKTGINTRRIAANNEFVSDMAIHAANNLFHEYSVDRDTIDFVLLCTQSPDYFLPTTACLVQDRLNLSKTIGALDFNLGCSGYVYGLALAKSLISSGISRNLLLITSETYSKFINSDDKSNRTIFGDAATATLISSEVESATSRIGDFTFGTDGSGFENLIVKNGGLKNPNKDGKDIENDGTFIRNDNNLYMNGQEIFKFCTREVPKMVESVLVKNNLDLSDIDLFVFHQANQYMLDYLKRKLHIPNHKFHIYMEKVGNTVSSTIPIALKDAIDNGKIKAGSKVLLAGFGVGYSMSATVIVF